MTKSEWEKKVAELKAKDRSPKDDQELEALYGVREFAPEEKEEKKEAKKAAPRKKK